MMEFHSMTERWAFDEDPKFLYMHVIFRDGDDYFSAQLPERVVRPEDISIIDRSCLQKIPQNHIWPLQEDKLTVCPDPERSDVYIKQPRLTGYDGSASLGLYLLQEAHICQGLLENTHENVARYLGCVVKDGRITGLCFQKYAETLADRLRDGRLIDNESCLRQVKSGIDHLHALNIVHNDIHQDNIMFTARDGHAVVVIDFDSCAVKGCPLPGKRGVMPEGARTAEFENDNLGLHMLWEELGVTEL
ncbi:unnamed protein product [Penicillium salamii]|nr:unnamed protein product [Penicillium salamii]